MNKSEQLEKKGYVVLPNVLSADEVKSVRARLKEIFSKESIFPGDLHANGKIGFVYADVFNRYPELNWIFQKEELLSGLRSLLGDDFVFLPESALHHAGYGGMHKDTNAQEKAGYTFHWDNDFNVVQVGIYLQDNHPEYAGGLDVIPGSNHVRWGVQPNKLASIIKRNWNRLARKIGLRSSQKSLFTKAGDAAVFNLRTDHGATQPKVERIPDEFSKFAIFVVCSRNNKHAITYTNYIKSRGDYVYLKEYGYSQDFLRSAQRHGMRFLDPNSNEILGSSAVVVGDKGA